MLALRQGAARLAPRPAQALRTTRRYASGGAHHAQEGVNEPLGTGIILAVAGLPLGCALYFISQPGENGEAPRLTKWIQSFRTLDAVWEERGALHAAAITQASFDRNLLFSAPRAASHELRYPESFQSCSPRNVTPGSVINMDAVTERYRKQHQDEEDRKARKTAAQVEAQKE